MNLADDERGRVPFALVGVVLLVASASAAAALATHDPAPDRTGGDRAVDRATTGLDVSLASAARSAFRSAARNPVVTPGNTTFGRAIDPDRAFRDALALRVYARFERDLRTINASAGEATANVSIPAVRTTEDAEHAIAAVEIERVDDDIARVTVSGVRVEVRRDDRVVSRGERSVTTTIHSPVLALHDRVQRFQRLLDRDALAGPGLDRRVTDLLHRVVWLRGPLQYGGAPIANVLANRHVELATNRALLDLQEAALGRADVGGRRAYDRAFERVGFRDVLAAGEELAKTRATDVLSEAGAQRDAASVGVSTALKAGGRSSSRPVEVGVNVTADRVFVEFVDGDGDRSLDGTLRAAFTSTARRTIDVGRVDETTTQSGTVPENWTVTDTTRDQTTRVTDAAPAGDADNEFAHSIAEYGRSVVVTERTTRTYANGSRERTVVTTERETFRVTVGLGFEVTPPPRDSGVDGAEAVLDRPAGTVGDEVHDRIAACATRMLVANAGGVDALARRAATSDVVDAQRLVRPDLPEQVRERAYRAVALDRSRARNVTENVSTRALAAGRTPVDDLRERALRIHDASDEYSTVTARAVAAVRETYLARLASRLGDRRADGALAGVGDQLGDRGLANGSDDSGDEYAATVSDDLVASVEGAPAYLTLGEVDPELDTDVAEPYHPLAARNVNWFTVPHGDVAAAVLSAAMPDPPETVQLGTAAQALAAANRTLAERGNGSLAANRDDLAAAVRDGVADADRAYRGVLAASNVSFTESEREAATRFAFARWATLDARATAIANGSAARAVADEAARIAGVNASQRDRLETRLRAGAPDVADRGTVRVSPELVHDTVSTARRIGRTVAKESLKQAGSVAAERARRRLGSVDLGAVPAGLPLAPVPGFWYATVNAWSVSVEGEWARFAVRARGGSPVGPGNGTAYVLADEPVAFDVNGDGEPDRVGRNERLSFEVQTTVGVVVPPGPRGVGDVDGDADEQSPGW